MRCCGMRILAAAATYFALVFAAGFLLGVVRTLWVAPAVGAVVAVLIEAPVMLGVSWVAWRAVNRRAALPAHLRTRAAVGGLAFAMLMIAEAGLSVGLFHRSLSDYAAGMASVAGLIGLAAQGVFAVVPVVEGGVGRRVC